MFYSIMQKMVEKVASVLFTMTMTSLGYHYLNVSVNLMRAKVKVHSIFSAQHSTSYKIGR